MGFTSKKIFYADPVLIPEIAKEVAMQFEVEGYEVKNQSLGNGGADISITKGGLFKMVVGLKSALKIKIVEKDNHIYAEAGVGIFGMQVLPTAVTWFVTWPVIIPQIWGLIKQSKLDNHAMDLIEKSIQRLSTPTNLNKIQGGFCPECGASVSGKFCSACGTKIHN